MSAVKEWENHVSVSVDLGFGVCGGGTCLVSATGAAAAGAGGGDVRQAGGKGGRGPGKSKGKRGGCSRDGDKWLRDVL